MNLRRHTAMASAKFFASGVDHCRLVELDHRGVAAPKDEFLENLTGMRARAVKTREHTRIMEVEA
jgi:hypothetical protein